jgi:hypothetical protein
VRDGAASIPPRPCRKRAGAGPSPPGPRPWGNPIEGPTKRVQARPHPDRRGPKRTVRSALDYVLGKGGYVLTGSGGLSQLSTYSLQPMRLPVPSTSTPLGPTTFEVDLAKVTTPLGFSYAPEGWHPYRDTLAELLAEPDLPYEQTTLARFYDGFHPTTVQEAILEHIEEPLEPVGAWPPLLPLFKHLWSLTPRYVEQILANPKGVKGARQQFGPHPAEFGNFQAQRLVTSFRSLEKGYRPDDFPDGYLTGYFLVRGGDYRFVVFHGNHRLAAFERLGIDRPLAVRHRGDPPVVDAAHLDRWVHGRYGVYPRRTAELLFEKLFTETGREKAERLGLL